MRIIELSQRQVDLFESIQGLERDGLPHDPHCFSHYRRYENASYTYQQWVQEPDWFADDMLYVGLVLELEEIPLLLSKYQSIVSDVTRPNG